VLVLASACSRETQRAPEVAVAAEPLRLTPLWSATGEAGTLSLGWFVAGAGDVNSDGFADILVGSPWGPPEAATLFHYGGAEGVDPEPVRLSDYGIAAASAGDVDGDGDPEVIAADARDAVFLLRGSPDGLESSPAWRAAFIEPGGQGQDVESVASAGDVNGDGFDDVIVGLNYWRDSQVFAHLFLGSASGLPAEPSWTARLDAGDLAWGCPAASAGDVNGDGFADVVIGVPGYRHDSPFAVGRAYVYLGSASGLPEQPSWEAAPGMSGPSGFGVGVAGAGDVNGDGFDDVVISAGDPEGEGAGGHLRLYLGSAEGLADEPTAERSLGGGFGGSLSSAGDQNGDGFADWLVGDDARAFVFLGAREQPGARAFELESAPDSASAMRTVAGAGDVDGDGCVDILVGEPREGNGKVELFAGCSFDDADAVPGWGATNPQSGSADGGFARDGGDPHDGAVADGSFAQSDAGDRDAGTLTEGAGDGLCTVGARSGKLAPAALGLALLALMRRRRGR
jgi:hypothetical protein